MQKIYGDKKKKKCKLCKKQNRDFTDSGSCNKAEIRLFEINYLTFFGDDGADYWIKCNYCPKCGRKLKDKAEK